MLPLEALLAATSQLQALQGYWWLFCRLAAVLLLAPLFNHKALPARVRLLLAASLALALGGALPAVPAVDVLSLHGVLLSLEQIAFGLVLGLMLQLVFMVFSLVGELISTQMGMSMARYNDPVNGVSSTSLVYQLYYVMLALMFLALDGHLLVVSVVLGSFAQWPVGGGLDYGSFASLLRAAGWLFGAALLLGLPMVGCMFMVQFCFGLLNRISPSMNLFSLGFPVTIVVGLLCIWLTLPNMPEAYLRMTREVLGDLAVLLQDDGHG
ncbi:flagellar biosynthetic protein FliR [Pseudomonas sp. HR96]|uniref:flagellar biosynthetic protein FliR n=1 Tax=Pseudomonas sp. HR96 TaxID=1027966 RepID=UPI002A75D744|nr:flagellar biosynthetic protein FliR [Pseudomonas sp. HR96]WPP00043.1 flagellar biosynthetic protein FliR [Pseudomonas sp. HR96]